MKNKKLKEYLAPMVEVYAITLEKGFANSSDELKGATKGEGDKEEVGKYQEGNNWSGYDWNAQ